MKILFSIITCLVLFTFSAYSQDGYMAIVKSGVVIRETPNVKAKAIGSIKYGENVQPSFGHASVADTVNGMDGKWINIKSGKISGFVFNAYLTDLQKHNPKFPEHYPQYFRLNANCGTYQYFNVNFHWYGVFDTGDQYEVKRVNVQFSVKPENYYPNDGYNPYLKMILDDSREPLFLIGHEDSIANYTFEKNEFMRSKLKYIYPGQIFEIGRLPVPDSKKFVPYNLSCFGSLAEGEFVSGMKNYGIVVSGNDCTQNIMKHVDQPLIGETLPRLLFVGDLNNDFIPDVIISGSLHYAESYTYLFMSGIQYEKLVTDAACNLWSSCY